MIVATPDNRLYFVADYDDAALAHVWRGLRGRFIGGSFVIKSNAREEMVRKAATRIVEVK